MKKDLIKSKTIYQDQRVAEEFCNFRCEYCEGFCPSGYSLSKDEKGNLKVADEWYDKVKLLPVSAKKYFEFGRKMDDFYNLSLEIMEKTRDILYADILKISGGEVTTNENLIDFIRKIHTKYLYVQILTNGFNLTESDVKEYKKMKNVGFQISIDGVNVKSNYAKSHSGKVTEKVLQNIECMVREGIGLEINCVLTKYNTNKLLEFLERFKNADNLVIIPRPVRGKPKELLNFSQKQILEFEQMIYNNFDKYSNILPPKQYIDRLIMIMKSDKRDTECFIPFFVQSIDGYGNFEQCPIGLITDSNFNIFEIKNNNDVLIENHIFKDNDLCKNCTNQYEILNLYVEGKITKGELKKMPSLNSEEIITHIDEIKKEIIESELKRVLKEKYNLIVERIEKNEQSTAGNVYIIYCKNERYVIKIYNSIEHTKSMVKLHNKLVNSDINVPKIIFTKEKENYIRMLGENYIVVYSFLEGEQIGWNSQTGKLDDDIVISLARELKKVHSVTSNNEFNLPIIPFKSSINLQNRKSALHFDLTRNNIFKSKNKIGIIDFDDAKYGDTICDIAILIANLFFSKTRGVDLDGMKKFIDEYYSDNIELKEIEVPLIKTYALQWINYILDGNEFDTSTTESFEIRHKLIDEYL